MRALLALSLGCVLGAFAVAHAADPPAPPAPVAAAPTAAANTAATPSAPASPATPPAAPSSTVVVTGKRSAEERQLIMAGWKEEMHNGEKVFCRWQDQIGSRLEKTHVCGSFEQIKESVLQTQDRTNQDLDHAHTLTYH
jgi:hypothetical protein